MPRTAIRTGRMTIWNLAHKAIMVCWQNIAIFV
jgi:hypothetical protein